MTNYLRENNLRIFPSGNKDIQFGSNSINQIKIFYLFLKGNKIIIVTIYNYDILKLKIN